MHSQLMGLTLMGAAAFAQGGAPKEALQEENKAPRIAAEMRARFWRSQAEAIATAARAKQAQEALKAAQEEMQKTCGDKFSLALDAGGEPSCQAKQ